MMLHNLILWHPMLLSVLLSGWLLLGILCLISGMWLQTIAQEGGMEVYGYDLLVSFFILFLLIWLLQEFFRDLLETQPHDNEFHTHILKSLTGR